jgi:arylsulfatase A-like enzyme
MTKSTQFIFGLVIITLLPFPLFSQNLQKRPNVIVILTDDQGTLDMNSYGSEDLITPHMDAIAASGVSFTQFYAAAPVCSPSRAGLLTGKAPLRAGLPGNVPIPEQEEGAGLSPDQITIAEMMKSAGYKTGHIGKWHLGHVKEKQPNAQGFDYSFGHLVGCIDNYSHFFYWAGPNKHDLWRNGEEVFYDGEYFPDLTVKEVNRFMEENQKDPFFIYWAINVPHYPYQGHEKWLKKYQNLESPRREYAAFLSTMDEKIGEVMDKLEELQLKENTIVIFQSDHGHSREERAFFGGGNAGPYRGAKFSMFEGGLRVPAMISMPGTLPEGEVRDQMAVSMDWMPTIAELCKVNLPGSKLDGKSLVSVIQENAVSPHEVIHWQIGEAMESNSSWAVRSGDWKLLGNPRDPNTNSITAGDSLFLVNLSKDISESNNLATEYPDQVEKLKSLHDEWVQEIVNQQ